LDKKKQILHAGQILFGQLGPKKVTMDDIARKAHVSKATIYKHYANKAEIFHNVVQQEANQLLESIEEAVKTQPEVVGKLRAHLITRLGKVQEFVNFYRLSQDSWGDFWPDIATIRQRFLLAEKEILKGILEYGVATGCLQLKQLEMTAHILVVALASIEFQWSMDEYDTPLPVLVDGMLEMMIDGIGKR